MAIDPDQPLIPESAIMLSSPSLTPSKLRVWISRGYVIPQERPGPGRSRRFSFTEAIIIAALGTLTAHGLPPRTASHLAENVAIRARDRLAENEDFTVIEKVIVYSTLQEWISGSWFIDRSACGIAEMAAGTWCGIVDCDVMICSFYRDFEPYLRTEK